MLGYLAILFASIYWIGVTGANVLEERLFTRQNISNYILKENEIITLKLRDFFGGSLNEYVYEIKSIDANGNTTDAGEEMYDVVQINSSYVSTLVDHIPGRNRPPLREMYVLLNEHQIGTIDRTMIMHIDEEYFLEIIDFTDHRAKQFEILESINLLNVINTWFMNNHNASLNRDNFTENKEFKALTPVDLHCNNIAVVDPSRVYVVPCHNGEKKFLIWIITYRNDRKFTINAFVHFTENVLIDERNSNALTAILNIVKG